MSDTPSFPFPRSSGSEGTPSQPEHSIQPTYSEDANARAARELLEAAAAQRAEHPEVAYAAPREPREPRRVRKGLLIGGGVGLALVLGLGGGAAYAMSAHGDYAYNHVAAGASVYAQLNMDPSMMQKMQLNSFLSKLPKFEGKDLDEKAGDRNSVAKAILDQIAPGNTISDYSWAGSRYAVVAYGSPTSLSSSVFGAGGSATKSAIVIQVSDQKKALSVLSAALQKNSQPDADGFYEGSSSSPTTQVQALDNDYVVLGDPAGIAAASAHNGAHLSDDEDFKKLYTEAGDPLSFWGKTQEGVAAGSVRADWGSLVMDAQSTGQPTGISAAAEAQNLSLTGGNNVAQSVLNFGLADPNRQFGPSSPVGKQLLQVYSAYGEAGDQPEVKQRLQTAVDALGDNVSLSLSQKGGRVLLHGSTEAKVNSALTSIVGTKTSLDSLTKDSASDEKITVQDTPQGLALGYGQSQLAPTKLEKVAAGSDIAQIDLTRIPKELAPKTDVSKLGAISYSASSTADGAKLHAAWDLP